MRHAIREKLRGRCRARCGAVRCCQPPTPPIAGRISVRGKYRPDDSHTNLAAPAHRGRSPISPFCEPSPAHLLRADLRATPLRVSGGLRDARRCVGPSLRCVTL
eukprot:gene14464-biopygen9608